MPLDSHADTVLAALTHAPAFAHGQVRDLRVRWACEEIGKPYRTELFSAMGPRPDSFVDWQPFNQVPAIDDDGLRIFESGAILLYLGEQDERLLPRDAEARWRALSWVFAALNTVEPPILRVVGVDIFLAHKPWAAEARSSFVGLVEQRFRRLQDALGDKDWLAGPFSIADILMVTVLRGLDHCDILAGFPALAAYKARGEARPAFQRALADQIAELGAPAVLENAP